MAPLLKAILRSIPPSRRGAVVGAFVLFVFLTGAVMAVLLVAGR